MPARSFADPDAAARKLVEIAKAAEAVQDGRIAIELINLPFLQAGGTARVSVRYRLRDLEVLALAA